MNEIAILVSALLAIAIGSIWYSPLLFGGIWMRAAGLTSEDVEPKGSAMWRAYGFSALATLVTLVVISQFLSGATAAGESVSKLGLLLVLLNTAFLAVSVIWERKPASYLFINAGYNAIIIFMGIAVIGHWPW